MATGRVPTTANSPLTTKGDLFGYSTSPARLAVGSDGETIVADSSTSTGLRYNPTTGNLNFVINGGMDIWQRGTLFAGAGIGVYLADRWVVQNAGVSPTYSQQSTGAPSGSRYVMRIASGGTGSYANVASLIETSNAALLWGQSATLQVKVRRNASFATSITIYLQKSATVDAAVGATWTTISSTTVSNANLPTGTGVTDWFTATTTGSIPNDGTANSLRVLVTSDSTFNSGAYYEFGQAKLEAGSVATAFTRAGGTIQGELAACQRYYWRKTSSTEGRFGFGSATDATQGWVTIRNPITMRANPTSIEFSGVTVSDGVSYTLSVTAIANTNPTPIDSFISYTCATGQTARYPAHLNFVNGSGGYFGVNAEL